MGRITQFATATAVALLLAGCAGDPAAPVPGEVPEIVIALKEINDVWLQDCPEIGDRPGGAVGDLLQDFSEVAQAGAICQTRHRNLRDYVRPLVEKAKAYSPP